MAAVARRAFHGAGARRGGGDRGDIGGVRPQRVGFELRRRSWKEPGGTYRIAWMPRQSSTTETCLSRRGNGSVRRCRWQASALTSWSRWATFSFGTTTAGRGCAAACGVACAVQGEVGVNLMCGWRCCNLDARFFSVLIGVGVLVSLATWIAPAAVLPLPSALRVTLASIRSEGKLHIQCILLSAAYPVHISCISGA